MRPPSAEPRDLLRGPAAAGAAARRRRRRPPRRPSRRGTRPPGARSPARARTRAGRARSRRGRSGRRRARGRPPAMPGPRSRTVSSPSRRRTSTTAPGGLHFAALSSRFATARSSRAGTPCDQRRLQRGLEGHARRVPARPLDRGRDEPVQPHVLDAGGASGSSSRASSTRSPTSAVSSSSWATRSAAQPLAVPGVRRAAAREHLEVRAQRGERRPQLVRGVGDELALRALGSLERLEHRVERARQAGELVVAVGVDAAERSRVEATCSAVVGELGHRRTAVRVASRESRTGERDPGQREHAERPAQGRRARCRPRSASAPRRSPGSVGRARDEDAHVACPRSCGRRRTAPLALRDRAQLRVVGQRRRDAGLARAAARRRTRMNAGAAPVSIS